MISAAHGTTHWAIHNDRVRPEWVDANGHMNLAYYVVVFDRGADAWLDMAGLGAPYRATEHHSVFAVETHTIYRQEVGSGAALQVRTRLADMAGKRLHLLHEMTSDGTPVAFQEVLFVHVDLDTRRAAALSPGALARVAALMPPPDLALPHWIGRRVGLSPRS